MYVPTETPEEKEALDQIERNNQSEVDQLVKDSGLSCETCEFLLEMRDVNSK
jgi:hypothetical protein